MPRIPDATVTQLKQSIDLVALIQGAGVSLKKRGTVYQGRCPFHADDTPSFTVNPAERLWHCFGCDKGGDAIRFVELKDQVEFPEAVKRLSALSSNFVTEAGDVSAPSVPVPMPPPRPTAKPALAGPARLKLLARVAAFYHQRFLNTPEGLRYLTQTRGIKNVSLFKTYQIGLADGSLFNVLPTDPDSRAPFIELGVITESGREFFAGCVVFPLFDKDGNVVNLYGRRIESGEVNHLYLPGPRVGLWNYQAAKRSSSILLCESIIDALTLIDRGLHDVMSCYGVYGMTDYLVDYLKPLVKHAVLCFDGDQPGRDGMDKVSAILKHHGISSSRVVLADGEDCNSFLHKHDVSDFVKSLPKAAQPQAAEAAGVSVPEYVANEHGFTLRVGSRCYEIKAIARQGTQLKATIKATADKAKGFELHTLDLYSQRSREAFARSCLGLFDCPEPLLKEDLANVLEHVEAWRPATSGQVVETVASDAEQADALAFLQSPDLCSRILADLETLGLAGEKTNKLLCYLAAVSRKLDDPLSILIQSRSAAGKSTLQNTVLALVPDSDKEVITRMTDQALYYQEEGFLKHKVLALEEAEGLGGAAYSLRALQSSKNLRVASTSKDPVTGKMKTEYYSVQGPVAVLLTTTSPDLDEETKSRFLTLTIDESTEMTEAILQRQRYSRTLEGYLAKRQRDALIKKHHVAQTLLEPLVVLNPYSEQLTFPAHTLRARRDHVKYLMLIDVIAFLHQKQREVFTHEGEGNGFRYVLVDKNDIRLANELAHEALGHSLDELSAPARNLVGLIHEMVKAHCEQQQMAAKDYVFTRKTIRDFTGWSDWQVRTHAKELEDLEYLRARLGAWGKEYVYELAYQGVPSACPHSESGTLRG